MSEQPATIAGKPVEWWERELHRWSQVSSPVMEFRGAQARRYPGEAWQFRPDYVYVRTVGDMDDPAAG